MLIDKCLIYCDRTMVKMVRHQVYAMDCSPCDGYSLLCKHFIVDCTWAIIAVFYIFVFIIRD